MPASAAGFADLGSAVDSIFGAVGAAASAKGYKQAAGYAEKNAELAQESTRIQELQASRKIYQTLGGQQADIAGAGLAKSGGALDIMRDSANQGSLTKQLIANQGAITVSGYEAESANYNAMATAAKAKSTGGFLSSVLNIGAAVVAFSDDRLKENITLVERRRDGLSIVDWNFKGSVQKFRGVLASEVERLYPRAVSWQDGYRVVDYTMLGVTPEVLSA